MNNNLSPVPALALLIFAGLLASASTLGAAPAASPAANAKSGAPAASTPSPATPSASTSPANPAPISGGSLDSSKETMVPDDASASRNAARTRMHECGHQWSSLKKTGAAAGLTWKEFSQGCLARK
jgi:hypothetical protein